MGTQGTMTSPGRGTQRNWLVVSWPSPARTLTDSWKVRGQVAFESSDRFNAPPPPSHLTTFDLDAPWLARSFFSHCIRQRSYPLRSESSFKSRPILFSPLRASPHSPSRLSTFSLRTLAHLWSLPLSLSLSLINVSLRSLSVNDKRWKFFYFFFSFLFLVNTIRGRGGRYRGEESARRFYRGPFFSRTPRNWRVGRGGNILSLDSIPRERSVAMILEKIGRVG